MPTAEAPPVDAGFAVRQRVIREDYELDLRVFFRTLFRQWLLVAACVALALGAAVLAVYLQPRNYLAVSQVFIQRPKTNLGIEPRFITQDTARRAPGG
ncbi:MAG TPA: Wzz/FepE/Etk N-terminal domain-containing protein [Chloroflexota bacterium]|nr:Wzz/FepE/Etk N-terminal domain-containing protein [Chloroflexota bacterium]